MIFCMFSDIFKKHKIFNSIIGRIFIYMMHNFLGSKITTNMFFHNKAMLKNYFVRSAKGMIWTIYPYISCHMISFSFIIIRHLSLFKFCIRRMTLISISNSSTLIRTKYSMITWKIAKFFFAGFAYYSNFIINTIFSSLSSSISIHISSLIKKPLFGGLSRTVKFSHLLGGILDKINLSSISKYSVSQNVYFAT